MSCFAEPCTCIISKVKVELDWSNYATKSDLQNAAGVDTSNLFKRLI